MRRSSIRVWQGCTFVCLALLAVARAEGQKPYRAYADAGIAALQQWYDPATGVWKTTGWWNAANALEAVVDYTERTHTRAYLSDIATTFEKHRTGRFLNRYYDDEGWWALAWIKAYDLTGETRYLAMARDIFDDIKGGWDADRGGVWWNKDRKYKNAIPNELFLTLAARLHRRTPGDDGPGSYRDWAQREWDWFLASGMINAQNLINDGLTAEGKNNGGPMWTYNQGVILGGLVEMYAITRRKSYLERAQAIADAAIHTLVNGDGILVEPCETGGCGGDGPQFKGIFMRNLGLLYTTTRKRAYRDFLRRNADSLWTHDRNASDQFGLRWAGPFDRADAARQSAALDALNAALR
jgi:predicted alpha-1,6-mannanase (GH76 family)